MLQPIAVIPAPFLGDNGTFSDCAAPGAAFEVENPPVDPDLQGIINPWPCLSESVKDDLLAMVKAADDAQ